MLPAEIALEPARRVAVGGRASPRCRPAQRAGRRSTRDRVALLVGTPLAEVERELIEATIAHCDGSIPRAAKMLAVSPSTIYRKLESLVRRAQRRSGT